MNAPVFITAEEIRSETNNHLLIAMGLNNWGCCMRCNGSLPNDFSEGMMIIGDRLKIAPTPDNLKKLANELRLK